MEIFDAMAVIVAGKIVAEQTQVIVNYLDSDQSIAIAAGGTARSMAVLPAGRMMQVSWDMVVPTFNNANFTFLEQYINCSEVPFSVLLRGNGAKLSEFGFFQKPTMTSSFGSNMNFQISIISPQAFFA